MPDHIRVARYTGVSLLDHIPDLARLRIEVFRDFPYLYDGDMAYEERYLKTYIESPGAVVVVAFNGDTVIGASTAVPLVHETPDLQAPFRRQGIVPAEVFYFGESVLRHRYRGRGLGVRFFHEREAHVREWGTYRYAAFCAVERPVDHPRRPAWYTPLDTFWRKRGFEKQPVMQTQMEWRDLDDVGPTSKPMVFWMKALA